MAESGELEKLLRWMVLHHRCLAIRCGRCRPDSADSEMNRCPRQASSTTSAVRRDRGEERSEYPLAEFSIFWEAFGPSVFRARPWMSARLRAITLRREGQVEASFSLPVR